VLCIQKEWGGGEFKKKVSENEKFLKMKKFMKMKSF